MLQKLNLKTKPDKIKLKMDWTTQKWKISDLYDHPKNPRTLSREQYSQLQKSFKKFGYVEPLAINQDGMILAGHMRIRTLQRMGIGAHDIIDVRVPNRMLSPQECSEYLIRSNKNTGSWDYEILSNEWEAMDLMEYGFKEDELIGDCEKYQKQIAKEDDEKKEKNGPNKKCCPNCGVEF